MENWMKKILSLILMISLSGCTHAIYKLEVEPDVISSVHQTIGGYCGSSCEVEACWYETEQLVVCNVYFSFVTDSSQIEVLLKSSEALAAQKIQAGFCGKDTLGTIMVAAFIGGLIGGAIDRGIGGGHYGGSTGGAIGVGFGGSHDTEAIYKDREVIKRACGSDPEGLYKRAG
jgi:hypothetical protein